MHIYLKNNVAKLHPDPIWNDEALGYFRRRLPQRQDKQQDECLLSI